jgi:hypothetical protein
MAIVSLSVFLLVAFQTVQLVRDHSTLSDLKAAQEPTIQESIKLRQQLEALAGKTAQLAADGDESARAIVEQMRRQGVNMTPPLRQ